MAKRRGSNWASLSSICNTSSATPAPRPFKNAIGGFFHFGQGIGDRDAAHGSSYALRLHAGLVSAVEREPVLLTVVAEEVLEAADGRLWAGYRAEG